MPKNGWKQERPGHLQSQKLCFIFLQCLISLTACLSRQVEEAYQKFEESEEHIKAMSRAS